MVDLSDSGQKVFDIVIQVVLDVLDFLHNVRLSMDVFDKLLVALPKLRRLLNPEYWHCQRGYYCSTRTLT